MYYLTLSAKLKSMIGRAFEEDENVMAASLDLSAAFNIVNIDLPKNITDLIRVWHENWSNYGSIDSINSNLYDLLLGTVLGSILGPMLYAIFVALVFTMRIWLFLQMTL
jgi:hypothetical protein